MNKIIIVDDHSLFREGIKLLIENEGLGKVIAEAENGQVLLKLLEQHSPDLVIMDIEMPVMNGLVATREALKMKPCLKVLVLTMLNEKANYMDMVDAGAMGFVLKTSGKVELEKAINAIMRGENYVSTELFQKLIFNVNQEAKTKATKDANTLTQRESEILSMLCKGLSVSEIAEVLFLSPKTIEVHRSALLRKTASKNTINLVLFAIKNKIVEVDY
jgi:DNA-binding NarL/FixJ family response regulator